MNCRNLSRSVRALWGTVPIVGTGVLGLALASGPASAQSLSTAITSNLGTICGGMVEADLDAICTLSNAGTNPSAGNAGTSGSLSPSGTEVQGAVTRHLEKKREADHMAALTGGAGMTGMNGAPADSHDMEFSLDGVSSFATATYERADKDTTSFDPGYGSNKYGLTLGADRQFGMVTAGLAFDYSRTKADFSNSGGRFDTDSYGGLVYASLSPLPAAFLDLSAGYARKDYSLDRFVSFTNTGGAPITGFAKGDTSGNEYRIGANTGYDFYRGRFTFGPRLGINYVHTDNDAFQEAGGTGLEMAFNSSSFDSAVSSVGVQGSAAYSTSFGVLVPQISFAYMHEFANGQQTLTGHLVQDLNATTLSFQNDSPDRDYFGVGVGVVAVLQNGYNAFANYHGTIANSLISTHTFAVGLRKEF